MKQYRNRGLSLLILVLLGGGLLFGSAKPAQAGYWNDLVNGVKELSQLPSEVNELKENYDATLDKLEETQGELESFRQQNEELMERNRELAATVSSLSEAQQIRDANTQRTRLLLLTGLALFIGYFIILRIVRLVLRR
ncbi:hypothetical protein SAMN04488542_112139 [Fontibacillus panacisegetis]|uniref:Uncharacterized protein n=1 Tax=Fontibacillus panacisegetis TaxID=670482 RepID=A0A1G7M1Q9_9BACL|nr:hypothetical protein [Fontibacillus panacisegetis]SDF55603.1 hypothetical protein SAMN04488542_112139 [Fontibacillus panacisegetis]